MVSNNRYNRLKIVLVEMNLANKELAQGIKKTEATISRWCTNDVQPSVVTLYKIVKFLDLEVRELLVATKFKEK